MFPIARRRNRDTRAAVYKLLVDGKSPNVGISRGKVAKLLNITPEAVRQHADSLEADGIIVRVQGCRNPVLYKRGPRSNTLDTLILEPKTSNKTSSDGGTVNNKHDDLRPSQPQVVISNTPPCTVRAHVNGRVIFSVLRKGDMCPLRIPGENGERIDLRVFEDEPYFVSRGVQMWKGSLPYNGGSVSIEYLESETTKQLHVWPQECELVPQQFRQAGQIFEAMAQEAANVLCRYGGWSLGLIQFRGKVELASTDERILAMIPEDMRGKPGSPLWIDCSTGPREIETDDPEAAEAVFNFPGVAKEMRSAVSRMDDIDTRLEHVEEVATRLVSIAGKLEMAVQQIASAESVLIERAARESIARATEISSEQAVMFG